MQSFKTISIKLLEELRTQGTCISTKITLSSQFGTNRYMITYTHGHFQTMTKAFANFLKDWYKTVHEKYIEIDRTDGGKCPSSQPEISDKI